MLPMGLCDTNSHAHKAMQKFEEATSNYVSYGVKLSPRELLDREHERNGSTDSEILQRHLILNDLYSMLSGLQQSRGESFVEQYKKDMDTKLEELITQLRDDFNLDT